MAPRGSVKRRSVDQEDRLAKLFGGIRSESSGASDKDGADVICPDLLIEAKYTGGPEHDAKRISEGKGLKRSKLLGIFEKVALQAWMDDKAPAVALREWAPESPLSQDGWVDLIIRLDRDDIER